MHKLKGNLTLGRFLCKSSNILMIATNNQSVIILPVKPSAATSSAKRCLRAKVCFNPPIPLQP